MTTARALPFVLTYGPSGAGKTVDNGYSFPTAIFVSQPGATTSIEHVCGYSPSVLPATDIEDAIEIVNAPNMAGQHFVFDDFSLLAEQTYAKHERMKRGDGWGFWQKVNGIILDFRNACAQAGGRGSIISINAWEKAPTTRQDGSQVRGGPALWGKLAEAVPALCSVVLRCRPEPMRKPWPWAYHCKPSAQFVMKDRYNTANILGNAPMNIGELLRASGVDVPRHPDLDWQEGTVEELSALFGQNPADIILTANAAYKLLLDRGTTPAASRWTVRDAMDRFVIRNAKAQRDQVFIAV